MASENVQGIHIAVDESHITILEWTSGAVRLALVYSFLGLLVLLWSHPKIRKWKTPGSGRR